MSGKFIKKGSEAGAQTPPLIPAKTEKATEDYH
jgi:hypothetical protein